MICLNRKNYTFNLTQYVLEKNVKDHPDKNALIFAYSIDHDEYWTYSQIQEYVLKVARGLEQYNLPPTSRALIALDNTPKFVFAFLSCMAQGLVPIPCSSQLTESEIQFILKDTNADIIFLSKNCAFKPEMHHDDGLIVVTEEDLETFESLQPSCKVYHTMSEDPGFLIYTSGTTSYPKGVLHAHRNILGRKPMQRGWTGLEANDILLHSGQLNWTYTLGVGIMDTWTAGGTAIFFNGKKDPSVWIKLIEKYKATIFVGVPSLYRQIMKYCDIESFDLIHLKYGLAAGEPLNAAILNQWKEKAGTELFEALGMSEVSTYISSGPNTPIIPGSPGKPQPGRIVAILPVDGGTDPLPPNEIGLLGVHRSDPGLMLRYWSRPEEEAQMFRGEWFIGGDLALMDKNNYIWFHGRNNELMNSFGYRVSPLEVERMLITHPDVSEVAVAETIVGDEKSIITAFVVPKKSGQLNTEAFLDWAKQHMAAYKCPRKVTLVEHLPRNKRGKLIRTALT